MVFKDCLEAQQAVKDCEGPTRRGQSRVGFLGRALALGANPIQTSCYARTQVKE